MVLHNLVFVIDVDCEDYVSDHRLEVRNSFVKRGILYILLHFGYKYGFEKVRWGYTFFQAKAGRNSSVISRGSDFKELRHKTFEDFEQEFEARVDVKDKACLSQQRQQSSKSTSVQSALRETLLDFQWDRPDITSPTKLSLRPRKSSRIVKPGLSQENDSLNSGRNIVFVVSRCPRSREHLLDFLSVKDDDLPADMTDYILPRSLNHMFAQQQVVPHWIDTRPHFEVMSCEDCFGSDKLAAVLAQLGGRVIPVVALLNLCSNPKSDSGFKRETFLFNSTIGFLLSSERLYCLAFPAVAGVLRWDHGNASHNCPVVVEPVSRGQSLLQEFVEVYLKEVLQGLDASLLTQTSTESWVLQISSSSNHEAAAFLPFFRQLSALSLHMLAEVNHNGLLCPAVFSPLSHSTALLTILQPMILQHDQLLKTSVTAPVTAETSADLPDVVNSVLGVVYDIMNEDSDGPDDEIKEDPAPEWAVQELSHRPLTTNTLETWFPQSDQSGVSAHLMESIRLLHAVPDQVTDEDPSEAQQDLVSSLSELYLGSQESVSKRGKKRGAHRTPVKQKMKTMSRSLQMLNVARLNVKAQKSQTEAELVGTEGRGADRPRKRRLSDRNKPGGASALSFSSEKELLCYLKASYGKVVAERDSSLLTSVQQLLNAVKTFLVAESDWEEKASLIVEQHLMKTSKSIRQLYGAAYDAEKKVRECQLQVILRLELCRRFSSKQSDSLDADQMAEEAAEMLRIISLTKDPVCLARFLQDEVLPGFLTAVPKVLADIYNSLGTQLPDALVAVLPADFFSDDSFAKDSISPSASSPPISTQSLVSEDGLHDLRNRSANKRRSGMLTRHRSMTESTHSLRQIQLPKKITRAISTALEKPVEIQRPQKQQTQEVTKVRRNLFNQEIVSPSKKRKLPRSQSVSAVEGLKRKHSLESEDKHRLLTKKVCETPLHKQVSSRLLQRQKVGRKSDLSGECIVEESPIKPDEDLRRSPRIKKFARRHSSTFYSSSQPRSRNLERALSSSQLPLSDSKICSVNVKTVQSPMRLLFGAAESPSDQFGESQITRSRLSTHSSVFESPSKTPSKSPHRHGRNLSPKIPRTPETPRTPQTPLSSKMHVSTVAESPAAGASGLGSGVKVSPLKSPGKEPLVKTPSKQSPVRSPLKGILRTPVKASGLCKLSSPLSKTPKKSVTWSPSPQKCTVEADHATFKVPKSPSTAFLSSLKQVKTPSKPCSPEQSTNAKRDIFKTPDKICLVSLVRLSEQDLLTPKKFLRCSMCNAAENGAVHLETTPPLHPVSSAQHISPQRKTRTQVKTPSPIHQMITRSGQTPRKGTNTASPVEAAYPPPEEDRLSNRPASVQSLTTKEQTETSQSSEPDSSPQTESQSSHGNSATTDDDSLDIVDATVVKTQFGQGIKMSISFSRKSSVSTPDCLVITDSPLPSQSTPGRSYGFRQTPDRQQREAAARLGYGNDPPRFSTPRSLARSKKDSETLTALNYQVELEMQTSGLPKLKIKRTDSMNADDFSSGGAPQPGAQSPLVGTKPHVESPLALMSKHKDPARYSPSVCAHVTPAKCTPGKGGGVQTYICQSYTPTRHSPVPLAVADLIPLTPSPQSMDKVTPDNLNSWPRRKRPQLGVFGGKDRVLRGEPRLEEQLEEAELGVSRLQDFEDAEEPSSSAAEKSAFKESPSANVPPLSPMEDLYWMTKLAEGANGVDSEKAAELIWASETGDIKSTVTPPSRKGRKPVTPSGILALTQSPLLFKGKPGSALKKTPDFKDEAASGRTEREQECSPFSLSQPTRHSNTGKTYSRKRLLH